MEVVVNVDDKFWNLVDEFIEFANQQSQDKHLDPATLTEAFMNAAARYSAFYLALSSENKDALEQDKDAITSKFTSEFKRLLASNLEDYIAHYNIYINK